MLVTALMCVHGLTNADIRARLGLQRHRNGNHGGPEHGPGSSRERNGHRA